MSTTEDTDNFTELCKLNLDVLSNIIYNFDWFSKQDHYLAIKILNKCNPTDKSENNKIMEHWANKSTQTLDYKNFTGNLSIIIDDYFCNLNYSIHAYRPKSSEPFVLNMKAFKGAISNIDNIIKPDVINVFDILSYNKFFNIIPNGFIWNPLGPAVIIEGVNNPYRINVHTMNNKGDIYTRLCTNYLFCENWLKNKKYHSFGDKPAIKLINDKDDSLQAIFYKDGRVHRLDGPAKIIKSGLTYKHVEYIVNGKYHRNDGPAIIHITKAGVELKYYVNGKHISNDLPAEVEYDFYTDLKRRERFYDDNQEEVAMFFYHGDGINIDEVYLYQYYMIGKKPVPFSNGLTLSLKYDVNGNLVNKKNRLATFKKNNESNTGDKISKLFDISKYGLETSYKK